MVPPLHQTNGYIKRKLGAWRAQKLTAIVGAETALTSAGSQTTPFHGGQHRTENGKMRQFGPTNPHGTAFTPQQCLHQRKLGEWRAQKCNAIVGADTELTSAGPQTTQFHVGQRRAKNGKMRNFGSINPHGTAFPPKQWLHQEEARGMESSKM